jgi:hypothetical protein
MFKRIETWLRRMFSDELNRAENNLKDSFAYEVKRVSIALDCERGFYLAEIRSTLAADLLQFRADLVAERLLVHVPQHWKADEETRKQDHLLRKKK